MAQEIEEIAWRVISAHMKHDGAALPILHALQEEFGYLPKETLPLVAEALNITRAEIYGVASFYHDFQFDRSGEHTLTLCGAEACQSMGAAALAEHAKRRLGVDWGETVTSGRVTLRQTFCLGLCACAPSAMVDGKLVGRLTAEKLEGILSRVA